MSADHFCAAAPQTDEQEPPIAQIATFSRVLISEHVSLERRVARPEDAALYIIQENRKSGVVLDGFFTLSMMRGTTLVSNDRCYVGEVLAIEDIPHDYDASQIFPPADDVGFSELVGFGLLEKYLGHAWEPSHIVICDVASRDGKNVKMWAYLDKGYKVFDPITGELSAEVSKRGVTTVTASAQNKLARPGQKGGKVPEMRCETLR